MKVQKQKKTILNAADKFSHSRRSSTTPVKYSQQTLAHLDLSQLGELVIARLNDENLEVSKVRPFFWTLVETYLDRFERYPFDASKALFSYLEIHDYPETMVQQLVKQLETQFQQTHGRPLRKSTRLLHKEDALSDEIKVLRDSLKYAALVAETEE